VRGLTQRGSATDFWNRYKEDVDLARGLGCRAFRLSLSWARLEPNPGAWDESAFAHYRDVLQYMRDAGMATVVTLLHNTWPVHVQAAGNGAGLLDPGFPDRFVTFTRMAVERLGDLIDYYVTINEPNQLVYGFIKLWCMRAYAMPPGMDPFATETEQMEAVLKLIPNLFRAHAQARVAIRKAYPAARVGTNPLVLGLPQWFQHIVDRAATSLRTPDDLLRQARRFSQIPILDTGSVDVSIAQITITQERMDSVLFSEPYYDAHLALLHRPSESIEDPSAWKGCVGVASEGAPAERFAFYLPAATMRDFDDTDAAIAALRGGAVDAVFDDDVMLEQHASGELALTLVPGHPQHFAVAVPFGSRTLLNAVDLAIREIKATMPNPTHAYNRKTVAHIGRKSVTPTHVPDLDKSLRAIRRRGVLRVGVRPDVTKLCTLSNGDYEGLEPDLGRKIASHIFGAQGGKVEFVRVDGERRLSSTRSWLRRLDGLRKSFSMFATILGTNWWNLGMAGRLAEFLCPAECVGTLDYIGLDYYWGAPSIGKLHRLLDAAQCHYASAPVWPGVLYDILRDQHKQFPDKPIIVIENGCVPNADNVTRPDYIARHIREVQRALAKGLLIEAYLCWSITSNREWGLPFDNNSDFGLYYVDLDHDPKLARVPTSASAAYARIIAARSADATADAPGRSSPA
jgi:beta-glucosidase/6-phospho-beta-glucosidase/beta-galactosidase/ABC-type amino acid transport substrate-binding protein